MTLVTFFFFAHQPVRLKPYENRLSDPQLSPERLFDHYFDDPLNRDVFHKVAQNCYHPATRLMLELVEQHKDAEKPFKISYGLSGTFLLQAQRYDPGSWISSSVWPTPAWSSSRERPTTTL